MEIVKITPSVIKEVFRHGIGSSVEQLNTAISVSDMLKRRTVLGFFSEANITDIYSWIGEVKHEQDLKLDFIYTMYNSMVEMGITEEKMLNIYNSYNNFIEKNNLNTVIKDMYKSVEYDTIVFTLYFIRLYLEYFDNSIIAINNIKKGQ